MNYHTIAIHEVLKNFEEYLIIDVRSESEFVHAHIPNAISVPIFDDEQRKIIGTAYKQQSREIAIKIGLDFFGPNMSKIVIKVEELKKKNTLKKIAIHCWRGGMRSSAMAWLLNFYGIEISLIEGGYKTYRNWCIEQFTKDYPIKIIGGCTGAAKTEVILELQKNNFSAIDLEGLASHKGSAFGYLGMNTQPSQEQFENNLAFAFFNAMQKKPPFIFIEDESQRIGNVHLTNELWNTIRLKNIYFLDIPFKERLKHIVDEYGQFEIEELKNCIIRITKNLGGLNVKNCISFLEENNIENCFSILLNYYDKLYKKGIEKRENWETHFINIAAETTDPIENYQKIINTI